MADQEQLSRRERQIMDIIYARREASASQVQADIPDSLSGASVRTFLRILEQKGHLRHHKKGKEFIYLPTRPRKLAARSALNRVLSTFFGGSIEEALASHLADRKAGASEQELSRLAQLIQQARDKGK